MKLKIKYIQKFMLFSIIFPIVLTACSSNELEVIKYSDLEYDFQILKTSLLNSKELAERQIYLGNYDNKGLNFSPFSSIDQISIINSVEELNYHLENQYFLMGENQKIIKYKYGDTGFANEEKIKELKIKYSKDFFKNQILVINAGGNNTSGLKIPKIMSFTKKIQKSNFYEKLILQNSSNTQISFEYLETVQTAYFYELEKNNYFN